jgi:NADH dehydrogenase [ubiquinone] 1 alpha subcomplex assembly factor 5
VSRDDETSGQAAAGRPTGEIVPRVFDRALLRERRDRLARGPLRAPPADVPDFLLHWVADDIVARLAVVKRDFVRILDLGAHNGVVGKAVQQMFPDALVIHVDHSAEMLARCTGPRVVADEEFLPFGDGMLDLVVSGLALQLVNDLPGALAQIRRALKPDGLFVGAMLGGASLNELRAALTQAEIEISGGVSPRVAPFADVRDLGGLLQRAGFALPVTDADVINVTYGTAFDLMRELRWMSGGNVLAERRRVPATRGLFLRAAEIYAERFANADGRVRATFEVLTMTGWAPDPSQQKPLRPGSAAMRLADALGTAERATGDKAGTPTRSAKPEPD